MERREVVTIYIQQHINNTNAWGSGFRAVWEIQLRNQLAVLLFCAVDNPLLAFIHVGTCHHESEFPSSQYQSSAEG